MNLTSAYYENYDKMIQSAAGREEFLSAAAKAIGLPPWEQQHRAEIHHISTTPAGKTSTVETETEQDKEDDMVVVDDYNTLILGGSNNNLLTDQDLVVRAGTDDSTTDDVSSCLEKFLWEDHERELLLEREEQQEECIVTGASTSERNHATLQDDSFLLASTSEDMILTMEEEDDNREQSTKEAPFCSSFHDLPSPPIAMRKTSFVIELDEDENPTTKHHDEDDDLSLLQDALLLPSQDEDDCNNHRSASSWILSQVLTSPVAVKQEEDDTMMAPARVTPLPIAPVSRMSSFFSPHLKKEEEEEDQHSLCSMMEDSMEGFFPDNHCDTGSTTFARGPPPYFPTPDVVFSCRNHPSMNNAEEDKPEDDEEGERPSSSNTWKVLDFDVALPKKKKPRKMEEVQELGSSAISSPNSPPRSTDALVLLEEDEIEEDDLVVEPTAAAPPTIAINATTATTITTATTTKKNNRPKFRLDHSTTWSYRYQAAKAYALKHGHCLIPHSHSDKPLAQWAKRQRFQHSIYLQHRNRTRESDKERDDQQESGSNVGCHLTDERVQLLNEIGFVWDIQTTTWMHHYRELIAFKQEFGSPDVPTNYNVKPKLGNWVKSQRRQYNVGKMTPSRIQMLEQIGFKWKADRTIMPIKKRTANKKQKFVLHKKN